MRWDGMGIIGQIRAGGYGMRCIMWARMSNWEGIVRETQE